MAHNGKNTTTTTTHNNSGHTTNHNNNNNNKNNNNNTNNQDAISDGGQDLNSLGRPPTPICLIGVHCWGFQGTGRAELHTSVLRSNGTCATSLSTSAL